ncbi:hypothetical protein L1765_09540 [Microaerobacter geothermalis]|uniref:competence type IV pilus minor pilin ComGF n=1 Tax=Microaerobacter geothermalis TaxID=674972 RepID=UPI001F2BF272|nr:competence type IV pilus minor pilin ComGF [Microaerobacter geothermalis]MCF6094206.1 hypothetical protein [Microaerobacter geothermalis]
MNYLPIVLLVLHKIKESVEGKIKKNQRGFTLLETSIQLMLVTIILGTVLPLQNHLYQWMENKRTLYQLQIEALSFSAYLDEEAILGEEFYTGPSKLFFRNCENDLITIQLYGYYLIKRVNGMGYVPIAKYVKSARFVPAVNGIKADILFSKGDVELPFSTFIARKY